MSDVNTIDILKSDYVSREKWEEAVKNLIFSLLETRQIMVVRYDEPGIGIVKIAFNPDNEEWGCKYPYWLKPDEAEIALTAQND